MARSATHWVVDTSILIPYFRTGAYRPFLLHGLERGTLFLPGAVFAELYTAATSRADRADLETLRRAFGGHLVGVEPDGWVMVGRCLSCYDERWGRIKPRDHLVDALVAVTAFSIGAVLASADVGQMTRWRWVARKLGRRLEVQKLER